MSQKPVPTAIHRGRRAGRPARRVERFGRRRGDAPAVEFVVGGYFEHLVITTPPGPPMNPSAFDGLFHFLRTGPELRVGASNERVFGYGLARLGVDLTLARPGGFVDIQGLVTLGGGVQGAVGAGRRLLLGVEPAVEVTFPIPWLFGRVRAFLGVRF